MLGKLLKHEFRATGRVMLPVLGVTLVLAVLANFSVSWLEMVDSNILQLLLGMVVAGFGMCVFAAGVMSLVVMIDRFYKNLLRDEGYLMFTLPVSVHGLVWSKLIVSFVWFVVTGLVIVLALGITAVNFSNLDFAETFRQLPSLGEALQAFYRATGLNGGHVAAFIAEFAILVVISALCVCLHFYAAMALGHCFSNRKLLMSILFFIGINILLSIVSPILGVSFGVGISHEAVVSASDAFRVMQKVIFAVMGYELVQGAVLYAATTLSLKKGLNLA